MREEQVALAKEAHKLRQRGRPRAASDEVRERNYRTEDGKYAFAEGLRFWHQRVVDVMLLEPNLKIKELAERLNVSPQWMGTLLKSDAFKEYYTDRLREHRALTTEVMMSKIAGTTMAALDAMAKKINGGDVPLAALTDAVEVGTRALGFGQKGGAPVQVTTNGPTMVLVGANEAAITKAREQLAARRAAVEHSDAGYSYVTASLEGPNAADD